MVPIAAEVVTRLCDLQSGPHNSCVSLILLSCRAQRLGGHTRCHQRIAVVASPPRGATDGTAAEPGAVRRSISASSLAPTRTTMIETHIQVVKPMIAPSDP